MNITRENIDELNAVLKVKIEKQDYEGEVDKVLKDYRKKANIKGFRPGMAPIGMIKKLYGKAVLVDEVNKLVSKTLTDHLVEEKLDILGEPLPSIKEKSIIDFENAQDFEFAFDIAFAPEFELKLSKRDKVPFYTIKVDDDMVKQTIESHTARNGKTEEGDVVGEKDLAKGKFEQLDAKGNLLEGGITAEDCLFAADRIEDKKIQKLIIGAKKDDIIDFELTKAFTNTADIASLLKISKEEAQELKGNFRFTLKNITRHIPAEINQDLFDAVFGKDNVKSEEEYKTKIVEEIQESFKYQSDYRFAIDAKEKLVAKYNLTLPDEFLKRWLLAVNKELTQDVIEKDYDNMKLDLAWQLIKNKIVSEKEIKLEEAELLDFAKKSVLMQFQQYGLSSIPDEQLEAYAKQMLSNEEEARRMAERKMEEKILEVLKETIKLDDKEVSTEEFGNLFK